MIWFTSFFIILMLILPCYSLEEGTSLEKDIKLFTLDNGMRFIILPRHEVPVFTSAIAFKVGGVDETLGITGISHMIEHMMFKGTSLIGTKNWGKEKKLIDEIDSLGEELEQLYPNEDDASKARKEILEKKMKELQKKASEYVIDREWDMIYTRAGGENKNAWTSKTNTCYYLALPSNKLELWFLMESERFINPSWRELYQERDVITEEYRMNWNEGDTRLWSVLLGTAFIENPQRYPIIGYYSDIRRFTRKKVLDYFNKYYIPNNAVVAIVGDVDLNEVKPLAEKYFGRWKKGATPPPVWSGEVNQEGERKVTVIHTDSPSIMIAYHMPPEPKYAPSGSKDAYVLAVISSILSYGKTSRLYKRLVLDKRLASSVSSGAGQPGARGPGLFEIDAEPYENVSLESLEKEIDEEIEKIKTEEVSKEELTRIITLVQASQIWRWKRNTWLAMSLALSLINTGDWKYDKQRLEEMSKITPSEVLRVAKKYLIKDRRTVGYLLQDKSMGDTKQKPDRPRGLKKEDYK
jgi:predicted Zn-dependent peptidase